MAVRRFEKTQAESTLFDYPNGSWMEIDSPGDLSEAISPEAMVAWDRDVAHLSDPREWEGRVVVKATDLGLNTTFRLTPLSGSEDYAVWYTFWPGYRLHSEDPMLPGIGAWTRIRDTTRTPADPTQIDEDEVSLQLGVFGEVDYDAM